MDKSLKYYSLGGLSEIQEIEPPKVHTKSDVNNITEQSTPKEISNFISQKLVEFIEKELKGGNNLALQDKMTVS